MKRYVKDLQIRCLVLGGLRGCGARAGGERGRACLNPVSWIAALPSGPPRVFRTA